MKWNHFSLEYSLVAIVSLNFQIFLSHIFSSWAHSKRFYASTNSSPLNKRSLDITRNITHEQYLLEHTCFIYIYIYKTLISDATDTRRYSSGVASIQLG